MSDEIAVVIVKEPAPVASVVIDQGTPGLQGPAGVAGAAGAAGAQGPAGPQGPSGPALTYGGTRAAPTLVAQAAALVLADVPRQMLFLAGNGGPVTAVTLPVPAGTQQEVYLVGTSDVNTVELAPGANAEVNFDTYKLNNKTIYPFYRDGVAGTKWIGGSPNGF